MEIAPNARKHGVRDEDMLHAVRNSMRAIRQGDDRVLYVGASISGDLLEVAVLDPEDDPVVIHAMPLRPKFYRYL